MIYTVFLAVGVSDASSTVACVFIALGGIRPGYYLAWHNTRVLAGIVVAAPFLNIAARSVFARVDRSHERVAAMLGLGPQQRFFRIVLPLAWPGIRTGLLLSGLRAIGEFGATVMVAYPPYSLPVCTCVAFGSLSLPAVLPLQATTLAVALLISPWRGSLRLSILPAFPARPQPLRLHLRAGMI